MVPRCSLRSKSLYSASAGVAIVLGEGNVCKIANQWEKITALQDPDSTKFDNNIRIGFRFDCQQNRGNFGAVSRNELYFAHTLCDFGKYEAGSSWRDRASAGSAWGSWQDHLHRGVAFGHIYSGKAAERYGIFRHFHPYADMPISGYMDRDKPKYEKSLR